MRHTSEIGQAFQAETEPIENFYFRTGPLANKWLATYNEFCRRFRGPNGGNQTVKIHRKVLGPPRRFTNSEFTFQVWEDRKAGWRVFVNASKGICFEVFNEVFVHGHENYVEVIDKIWERYTGKFESYFIIKEIMES